MSAQASPTSIGRQAEAHVARYLVERGYHLIAQNWRTRWCELDLVMQKDGVIHFVEVKYRRSTAYGMPADYISRDKQHRLIRAALAWLWQAHRDASYQIDVACVTGTLESPTINIIESAIQA